MVGWCGRGGGLRRHGHGTWVVGTSSPPARRAPAPTRRRSSSSAGPHPIGMGTGWPSATSTGRSRRRRAVEPVRSMVTPSSRRAGSVAATGSRRGRSGAGALVGGEDLRHVQPARPASARGQVDGVGQADRHEEVAEGEDDPELRHGDALAEEREGRVVVGDVSPAVERDPGEVVTVDEAGAHERVGVDGDPPVDEQRGEVRHQADRDDAQPDEVRVAERAARAEQQRGGEQELRRLHAAPTGGEQPDHTHGTHSRPLEVAPGQVPDPAAPGQADHQPDRERGDGDDHPRRR